MNRTKIHQNLDKTLDALETTKNCVSNKLSILSNKVRTIVKPIGLNIKAFKTAQKMGYASLCAQVLEKKKHNKELTDVEQLVFDKMAKKFLSNIYDISHD